MGIDNPVVGMYFFCGSIESLILEESISFGLA